MHRSLLALAAVVFAMALGAGAADASPIVLGDWHGCAIRGDGTLACWGRSFEGQTSPPAGTFVSVSGGAFAENGCALATDGTLKCWGLNDSNQSVAPSGTFIAVANAHNHSCAVRTDRTLTCWGLNNLGQSTAPGGTFMTVATGWLHSCGIRTNGTLACWGPNNLGQSAPPGGTFKAVSAGQWHSCALRSDGTAACWGLNDAGQASPPAGRFTAISTGADHNCGLHPDGTVECWGNNGAGQSSAPAGTFTSVAAGWQLSCGVQTGGEPVCWGGDTFGEHTPPAGPFGAPAARFAVPAVDAGARHSCGVEIDGTTRCWGDVSGDEGSFAAVSAGDGFSCGIKPDGTIGCWGTAPGSPPAGTFTAVSAGTAHACAVATDGTLSCWGADAVGQSDPPAGTFTAVAAGGAHSCGLKADGTAVCWGDQSSAPAGTYTAVTAGGAHTCALKTDGTAVCWGDLSSPPAGTYTAISAGTSHACAVRTDGTLACWGADGAGQSDPPAGTYIAVSAGDAHTCAVRADGTITCWGDNADERLGAAPAAPSPAPPDQAWARRPYAHTFTSSAGLPAGRFDVTDGTLPPGLTLDADGVLSGIPTTAGTFTFTVTASNRLFAPAASPYSITVTDDTTAPAIAPDVTGSLGKNGWYTGDVRVSWAVADAESGPTVATQDCDETTISADTAGTTLTCQATSAGGDASESVTVKRDATAPAISITAPRYGCTDGGSGVESCRGATSATGSRRTLTVTAVDRAGNRSTRSASYTVASAPPPPPPPAAAAVAMRLRSPRLALFGRPAVRCAVDSGTLSACSVRVTAHGRLIARGHAADGAVRLRLTRSGRALLEHRVGGVRATLRARAATSGGVRRATARTRALLKVEHVTTPPGSWTPGETTLTARGKRFVRGLRGKLIAVAALRCDGHAADRSAALGSVKISRARAATMCAALRVAAPRKIVGHGDAVPVAPNDTEAGRARNRRVEVTIRH